MPRPRKAPAEQLRALLRARCSADELVVVRARAKRSGLTVSQLVRQAVVGSDSVQGTVASTQRPHHSSEPFPTSTNVAPLHALVIAVNRAGNLVNQQMPLAHLRGEIPLELLAANQALEKALLAVADHFGR